MTRLSGKTIFITGAARGIGRSAALAMAKEGANLVLTDIDAAVESVCSEARALGVEARSYTHDTALEDRWGAIAAQLSSDSVTVNALVNNAGVVRPGGVLDLSSDDWHAQIAINLTGVYFGCKHLIPLISAAGGGSVVNVSSAAGMVGIPGLAGYCAAKGGVRLLSKSIALECALARNKVRCNSLHPGVIDTSFWSKDAGQVSAFGGLGVIDESSGEVDMAGFSARFVPAGHAGDTTDVDPALVYLVSDESRYVTGTEIVIDGGLTSG